MLNSVTIITVVFNDEERILSTLKSVSLQTYPSIEYVIIDGKSTDNTLRVIKDSGVKVNKLISEPDKGIYDAMNKGVRQATGEWVMFLNAGDTIFSENTFNEIFSFKNSNECDVIYGRHMWDYETLKKESSKRSLELMYKTLPFCHQASLTKRELLIKFPFDLQYNIIADYDFFRKLYCLNYKFNYCPIIFVNYLCTGGVSSNNMVKLYHENYRITKDLNIVYRILLLTKKVIFYYFINIIKVILPKNIIIIIKKRI